MTAPRPLTSPIGDRSFHYYDRRVCRGHAELLVRVPRHFRTLFWYTRDARHVPIEKNDTVSNREIETGGFGLLATRSVCPGYFSRSGAIVSLEVYQVVLCPITFFGYPKNRRSIRSHRVMSIVPVVSFRNQNTPFAEFTGSVAMKREPHQEP